MDIHQSINHTATTHPYSTAIVGVLFMATGFYLATEYTVTAYMRTIAASSDFVEAVIQREWFKEDIAYRKRLEKDYADMFKEKVYGLSNAEIEGLVDKAVKRMDSLKKMEDREVQLLNAELQLNKQREIVSFYYWYFRMLGILSAVIMAIGAILTTKGLLRVGFSGSASGHASKHRR